MYVDSKGLLIKSNPSHFVIVLGNGTLEISPSDMNAFTRTLGDCIVNENPKQTPVVVLHEVYRKGDTVHEASIWMKRNYNSISIYLSLITTYKNSQSKENSSYVNLSLYTAQKIYGRYIDHNDYDDENN